MLVYLHAGGGSVRIASEQKTSFGGAACIARPNSPERPRRKCRTNSLMVYVKQHGKLHSLAVAPNVKTDDGDASALCVP